MTVVIPKKARLWFAIFSVMLILAALRGVVELDGRAPTPQTIRALVAGSGHIAPLAFITLLIVRPFVFFPCALLFAAAGLAFGGFRGTVYSCIGYLLGAAAGFALARRVGRDYIEREFPIPFRKSRRRRWGPALVFFMNLVPVVPNGPVNFAAGLTRMGFGIFLGATLAGIAPWAALFSYFGDAATTLDPPHLIAVSSLVVIGSLAMMLVYRRRFPHGPDWVSTRRQERS